MRAGWHRVQVYGAVRREFAESELGARKLDGVTERTLIKNLAAASRRPRLGVRLGRDRARPEEGAVRRAARRVRRRAAGAPPRLRRGRHAVAEDALADHDLRPLARARFLTATGELKHDERVKLGGVEIKLDALDDRRRTPSPRPRSPTTPASTSAWTGASSTCASPKQQPHLPHPDHARARAAHLLGRARLHRDPHPEAHGVARRESQRRAVRGRLLRDQGLPRAEPAVLQADGAAGRLRQDLRGRPGVPRRPVVHRRHATEFTSVDAEISWIDSHEDVMKLHEELLVAGFDGGQGQARRRDRGAVRHRGDGAHRCRSRASRSPRRSDIVAERGYEVPRARRRHGPGGRAPDRRVRQGDVRARVRVPHRLRLEHPAVLPHAPRGRRDAHQQLRPHLQRRRDLDRRAARAPHRRARSSRRRRRASTPRSSTSTSTSSATACRRTAGSAWASPACSCSCCACRTSRGDLPVPRAQPRLAAVARDDR